MADCPRDALLARAFSGAPITASLAVVSTTADARPDTDGRLLEAAEQAIGRARVEGGNRLFLVEATLDVAWAQSSV